MWSGCLWLHLVTPLSVPRGRCQCQHQGDNTRGSASSIVMTRVWSFYKHIYLIFNSILSLSCIIIVPEKIFFPSHIHTGKCFQSVENWACLEGDRKFKAPVMLHRVTTPLTSSQATLHLLRTRGWGWGEKLVQGQSSCNSASLTDCSNDQTFVNSSPTPGLYWFLLWKQSIITF